MSDFTTSRSFIYVNGNIIQAAENNQNENNIFNAHNNAMHASTGHTHDGTTGNASPIVLQNASPISTRQLGSSGGILQVFDGTAARTMCTLETAQNISGAKTFAQDKIILASTAPTVSGSISVLNSELQYHDGTAARKLIGSHRLPKGCYNFSLVRSAANTIKITSRSGAALSASNPLIVVINDPATPGQSSEFVVTSDVSINIDSTTFGLGATITNQLLTVIAINDNGTLRWGIVFLTNRTTLLTTDTTSTASSATTPESAYCTAAVGSATNSVLEVGYFRADFTSGGNTWSIQTGTNDVVTGKSSDGIDRPWTITYGGFSVNPSAGTNIWTQIGRRMHLISEKGGNGTSNATTLTASMPAKARISTVCGIAQEMTDNGVASTATGMPFTVAASATLTIYFNNAAGAWTNVNAKGTSFHAVVPIGPLASFID